MNSEFGELSQKKYRSRGRRRRVYVVIGLMLIGFGYYLMGVPPDSNPNWVLARALGGMGCIVLGFGLAIMPLLSSWGSGE